MTHNLTEGPISLGTELPWDGAESACDLGELKLKAFLPFTLGCLLPECLSGSEPGMPAACVMTEGLAL